MLLKFALAEFKSDREYHNVSSHTLDSYMLTLKEFRTYAVEQEVLNLEDCSQSLVKGYLLYCSKERNNNPTTVNTKLHTLKIFFNYFEKEMDIFTEKSNPTKRLGFAKEEIKIEVFTDAQIKQMLNFYQRMKFRDKTYFAYRGYFLIIFLISSACRLGETVNLRWNNVNLNDQVITVTGKKRTASSIPMTGKLRKEFLEYKLFVEANFGKLPDYVFTNKDGEKLSENALKCIFKYLKTQMNFKNVRLSAHTFRHTAAHRMIMAGCDIGTVQKILRHSNVSMTLRYFALWGTALAEQNEKFNTLNNLDI